MTFSTEQPQPLPTGLPLGGNGERFSETGERFRQNGERFSAGRHQLAGGKASVGGRRGCPRACARPTQNQKVTFTFTAHSEFPLYKGVSEVLVGPGPTLIASPILHGIRGGEVEAPEIVSGVHEKECVKDW